MPADKSSSEAKMFNLIKKNTLFPLVIISIVFGNLPKAFAEEPTPEFQSKMDQTTNEEFETTKTELKRELASIQKRYAALEEEKNKEKTTATALAADEERGVQFMQKYSQLIQLRYLDANGIFDPNMEVNARDVSNLNSIFSHYLHSVPFRNHVSSGLAVQKLKEGLETLKQQIVIHSKPAVENDSELAINKREEDKLQERIKALKALETKFGISLADPSPTAAAATPEKEEKKE